MPAINKTLTELYDLQQFAIKLGLDNIRALTDHLGKPQLSYPVIHIAGTNGKGSTAFFLSRILQAMGLKTGLYTSPHLVDFRERIQVDETLIPESYMNTFWSGIRKLVYYRKATFFDVTTALALDYFRSEKVDVAVVETGLGGRLDSTNIVKPSLIVITPIQFDHEKQLGRNLTSIASEKAGIFKQDCTILSAKQYVSAATALKRHVPAGSTLYFVDNIIETEEIESSLDGTLFNLYDRFFSTEFEFLFCRQAGDFQLGNLALAYLAARIYLRDREVAFNEKIFREVIAGQSWAGRLHTLSRDPRILCDVSHNYHGIRKTVSFMESKTQAGNRFLLIGLVKDKNYRKIARYLSGRFHRVFVTEPETERRLDGHLLKLAFDALKQDSIFIKDLKKAFELAKKHLEPSDTLLIIGSHYLIGAYLADSN